MHPDYAMLREDDRTLAFIGEYADAFENYMKRTNRKWTGDPLRTLDFCSLRDFKYWDDCEGMRKVCDATDTDYGYFWRSAFEVAFGWDHQFPTPSLFYRKKGESVPNIPFLVAIIKDIQKPGVVVSNLPYYSVDGYVGSVQQKTYFQELNEKVLGMGREDLWQKLIRAGKIPAEFVG